MGVVRARDLQGHYVRLKTGAPSDTWSDGQFKKKKSKAPTKAIVLAICLFLVGILCLGLGVLQQLNDAGAEHTSGVPLLVLGVLTFIPGAYHVRIAFYAYRGYRGYSYDNIPSYHD